MFILRKYYYSCSPCSAGADATRRCTSFTMRLVEDEQQDTLQQQANNIGGLLKGIFIIMKTASIRQNTVTTYPPSSPSFRGSSLFGSRFANGKPAETDPLRVVIIVSGNVSTSIFIIYRDKLIIGQPGTFCNFGI